MGSVQLEKMNFLTNWRARHFIIMLHYKRKSAAGLFGDSLDCFFPFKSIIVFRVWEEAGIPLGNSSKQPEV
jgi:hypothetical protein